jgi:hypothetical protein
MHSLSRIKLNPGLSAIVPALLAMLLPVQAATLAVSFDDTELEPNAYVNGSDGYGAYHSGHARLDNQHNAANGSWEGFALSRVNNPNTAGWSNQYAVWGDGLDHGDGGGYAVGYYSEYSVLYLGAPPPTLTLPFDSTVRGVFVNNTAYTALSMLYGDAFAKKFGGADGTDPDWLKLTVTGYDAAGTVAGTADCYLADFRFASGEQDYILSDWTWLDLASLGDRVRTLSFSIASSDVSWGFMNTPAYFALDDLQIVPTPSRLTSTLDGLRLMGANDVWNGDSVLPGFSDLGVDYGTSFTDFGGGFTFWSGFACSHVNDTITPGYGNDTAVWGDGKDRSDAGNYAVFYDAGNDAGANDRMTFVHPVLVKGFFVNNTTYAALSMLHGDSFAKKFGGATGADPDWLKLTITARGADDSPIGTKEVYLADYRSDNPSEDYILSDWTWVDLGDIGPGVQALQFTLSSSDSYISGGITYYNTPAYFAMDELRYVHTFSGPADDDNVFDAGIPGFVGEDGTGVSDGGNNVVNPLFAAWATGVAAYTPAPDVMEDWRDASRALGPVTGDKFDIVSLGDLDEDQIAAGTPPGRITLTFDAPIVDKGGADFAVFENGLIDEATSNVFAELGYVEVSSDGIHFARFPSASLCTNDVGPYDSMDARFAHNLCGRHVNAYGLSWGTPFDLGDLASHPFILAGTVSLTNITHVRIEDIPGNGSRSDAFDPPNPIRDAWLTWGSGGVDLEAIGVINSAGASRIEILIDGAGQVAPIGYPRQAVSVMHGANQTFTFTPGDAQVVRDVRIDGVSIGATNLCTFKNLDRDHTLAVTFGAPPPPTTIHGVPVAWLDARGLVGASDEERALADPDRDGILSWEEYYAGTDPLDAQSRFAILAFERDGQAVSLSWLGGTNGSLLPFSVVGAQTPTGAWSALVGDLPRAATGTNTWSGAAGANIRFIRVRVQETE